MAKTLTVNGTDYRWPDHPVVVVCIDGGDPEYIEHGVAAGIIPNIARYMNDGFYTVVLERFYVSGNRWLANAQRFRRAREATRRGHRVERLKPLMIHRLSRWLLNFFQFY